MGENYLNTSEFIIEGQFLGFVSDRTGKFKYLRLASESGEVQIKIPKELRLHLSLSLELGEQIHVFGVSKLDSDTGTVKLKAYRVSPIGAYPNQNMSLQQGTLVEMSDSVVASTPRETPARNPPNAKIIVCQKSGCLKRGGKRLLSELEKMLCDRGLEDQVIIEFSRSCLKCCGSAPNYILQIGNKEYKKLHPEAIVSLLENNLGLTHYTN